MAINTKQRTIESIFSIAIRAAAFLAVLFAAAGSLIAQGSADLRVESKVASTYRIGEKLTYNVTFGGFKNAAYVETAVASSGTLSGRSAVELRSKIKTLEVVSAAFMHVDESRVIFVEPESGVPIYLVKTDSTSVTPKEYIFDYLKEPNSKYDLISVVYKARESAGVGAFSFVENGEVYTVTFVPGQNERVKTESGEFDTIMTMVQSEFLTKLGISQLKINFSTDEYHVPVLFRFKTPRADFRASLLSISLNAPEPTVVATPIPTPIVPATPKAPPTPEVYVDNRPLLPELGFQLGEMLEYRVTQGSRPAGVIALSARERKQFQGEDSLLLTAAVTAVEPGSQALTLGDGAKVQVDPDTLAPRWLESRFNSSFAGLSQSVTFDRKTGQIISGAGKAVEAPIGTHTLLSLFYAMRSFNLRPSKDPANPVNDTRVAVFWDAKPYIFTLRPSNPEDIMINGEHFSAQQITINTGDKELDALSPRVWIGTDSRIPLKFTIGTYQGELIAATAKPL